MNKRPFPDGYESSPSKKPRQMTPLLPPPSRPYLFSPGRPLHCDPDRKYSFPFTTAPEWDNLTQAIQKHTQQRHHTPDNLRQKQLLTNALFVVAKDIFPHCGLFIVGSSLNGFGSNSSDLDLCLMVSHEELDQKLEATALLSALLKAFRKLTFLQDLTLIRAKVPILRFKDRISSIECDLNINNSIGIRNTHLLSAYARSDPRVAPLVQFVKFWAKSQNINDASTGTISSYSLSLMVIHYMQYGCSPPALPSLQAEYPAIFSATQDVRLINLDDRLPSFSSPNRDTLGELFHGFLNYFANRFDFETDAMSVRLAKKVDKTVVMNQNPRRNPPGQWKYICIEEPFDLSNTARSVFDGLVFQRINRVIQRSWNILNSTHNVDRIITEPL